MAVGTAFLAMAAFDSAQINQTMVDVQRPILSVSSVNIQKDESNMSVVNLGIVNVGVRPAKDVSIEIYPLIPVPESDKYVLNPSWCDEPMRLANHISPNQNDKEYNALGLKETDQPEFLAVRLTYGDSMFDEEMHEGIYLYKWKLGTERLSDIILQPKKQRIVTYMQQLTGYCAENMKEGSAFWDFWQVMQSG